MRPSMRRHSRGSANDAASLSTLSTTSPMQGIPRRSSSSADSKPFFATTPRHASTSPSPKREFPTMGHLGLDLNSTTPSAQSHEGDSPESTTSTLVPSTPEKTSPPPLSVSRRLSARGDHSPPRLSLLQRQRSNGPSRSRPLSAGDLPSPPVPSSAVSPGYTPRTIRKKSGEIVKPSLKTRSMSTPDLSRGAQTDGEDGESAAHSSQDLHQKSVRFNDMGGLESVVHFLRGQKVTALSRSPDDPPTETDTDNDTDLSDCFQFRTRRGMAKSQAEENREVQVAASSSVPRLRVDFGPGTHGILKDEYVILERYDLQNAPLAIRGSVLVRNVAFQKWVTVRFTLDHWQTVSEVSAQHVSHVPAATTGDEGWDRFGFTIKLDDYKRKIEERALLLCIRYNTEGGREWWDSNNGDNYRFTFKRAAVRRPTARPTRPHSFHGHSEAFGLPTLRVGRQISMDRNVRSWVFPRTGAQTTQPQAETKAKTSSAKGSTSKDSPPLSPPPKAAFEPPVLPDVHSHLRLKKYCAPSPPPSPPKAMVEALPLAPVRGRAPGPSMPMTLVHGRPAHSWPPAVPPIATKRDPAKGHTSTRNAATSPSPPRSRETSPVRQEAAPLSSAAPLYDSPTQTSDSEEEKKNVVPKVRSNGNLQALANGDTRSDGAGLITPPSSNLSSPPTPSAMLPVPLTPSATASSVSTNDSSPLLTVPTSDDEDHGHSITSTDSRRILNAATYQEFIDKFCFFESPPSVSAPLVEPAAYRPVWPKSGLSSPSAGYLARANGHVHSHSNSHTNSPPRTATPTQRNYAAVSVSTDAEYLSERSATPTLSTGFTTPRSSPPTQTGLAA